MSELYEDDPVGEGGAEEGGDEGVVDGEVAAGRHHRARPQLLRIQPTHLGDKACLIHLSTLS